MQAVLLSLFSILLPPLFPSPPSIVPESGTTVSVDETSSLQTSDGLRYYRVHVPANIASGSKTVIALHGGGLSYDLLDDDQNPFSEWEALSDEFGFLLIVPNGTNPNLSHANANWAKGTSNQHWNDCRGDTSSAGTTADDVQFIEQLATGVPAAHGVTSGKVYISGQSNGGFMAQRIAIERPDLVRAVGSALAAWPGHDVCAHANIPVPIVLFKGLNDKVIPTDGNLKNGECSGSPSVGCVLSLDATIQKWREAAGAQAAEPAVTLPDSSGADFGSQISSQLFDGGAAPIVVYKASAAGHIEASMNHKLTLIGKLAVGNQNLDAETYRLFWNFFAAIN